jgi:hypothetical protein
VGHGEVLEEEAIATSCLPTEASAFESGALLAEELGMDTADLPLQEVITASLTRVRLGRFDPLSTLSVMLKLNHSFDEEDFALIQCIVRYVERDGRTLVTRVFTHRLAVAESMGEFLDSVDDEVVPVVLAKEAVYRSINGRELKQDPDAVKTQDPEELEQQAFEAQADVDATVQRISGAFRLLGLEEGSRRFDLTEEGQVKSAGSSFDFAFPPELADTLRRLYHFRRGPLVCPGPLQSIDDRAEMRSFFLRLPLEDCLCMMALSTWNAGVLASGSAAESYKLESVPPETMSLWKNVSVSVWCRLSLLPFF